MLALFTALILVVSIFASSLGVLAADVQGGSPQPQAQEIVYCGYAAQPKEPEKTGYTFTGWYQTPDLAGRWDFTRMAVNRDTTLYAGWQAHAPVSSGSEAESSSHSAGLVKKDAQTQE